MSFQIYLILKIPNSSHFFFLVVKKFSGIPLDNMDDIKETKEGERKGPELVSCKEGLVKNKACIQTVRLRGGNVF